MSSNWPPQLKDWVGKCLGQMTDANRTEAQAELKKVIADAFAAQTLWTTDWSAVQLQSLQPKPLPSLNMLKRKSDPPAPISKKAKKANKALLPTHFADEASLNKRAQRFSREHEIERQKSLGGKLDQSNKFSSYKPHNSDAMNVDDPEFDSNASKWDRFTIVGTSQELFKDYLRLTSEPKPEQIRPLPVLQRTLDELKRRWRGKVQYNWICSQFKSLRQDLTVQRIKNEFTVTVYEIHARMALEHGDLPEYNSCTSQLNGLYESGIPGKVEEFTAYRILFLLHGLNRSELNLYVSRLTPSQKSAPVIAHALAVVRAFALGNYHAFFSLYASVPNMGVYIMDHFLDRERVRALIAMSKAYAQLPMSFIAKELAFDDGAGDAVKFLYTLQVGTFSNPNDPDEKKVLDCRRCSEPLTAAYEAKFRKITIKGRV